MGFTLTEEWLGDLSRCDGTEWNAFTSGTVSYSEACGNNEAHEMEAGPQLSASVAGATVGAAFAQTQQDTNVPRHNHLGGFTCVTSIKTFPVTSTNSTSQKQFLGFAIDDGAATLFDTTTLLFTGNSGVGFEYDWDGSAIDFDYVYSRGGVVTRGTLAADIDPGAGNDNNGSASGGIFFGSTVYFAILHKTTTPNTTETGQILGFAVQPHSPPHLRQPGEWHSVVLTDNAIDPDDGRLKLTWMNGRTATPQDIVVGTMRINGWKRVCVNDGT